MRNGKAFEEPSETVEEIVGLIVNFANRPDLREVQERQVREIKALVKQARIDALDDASRICQRLQVESMVTQKPMIGAMSAGVLIEELIEMERRDEQVPTRRSSHPRHR